MFGIVTSHLRLVNFHIAICSVGHPGSLVKTRMLAHAYPAAVITIKC